MKRENELVEVLEKANRVYRDGSPIMSDFEYDDLEAELERIDPSNSFFRQMSDDVDFGEEKSLTIAMGSQDKAMSLEDMNKFYRRVGSQEFLSASEKLDGMSAEATYRKGKLVQVLTRGDGETGTDVTSVVKLIPTMLNKISSRGNVIVRGEIIMKKSSLEKLNALLVSRGEDTMSNTRNGTVGIVKSLKNSEFAKFLTFKAFDIRED